MASAPKAMLAADQQELSPPSTTTPRNGRRHRSRFHPCSSVPPVISRCSSSSSSGSVITSRDCIRLDSNSDNNNNHNRNNNNNRSINRRRRRSGLMSASSSSPLAWFLVLLVGFCLVSDGAWGFVLDGSQNSFAQFRKWYTGLNGTLELEFKTEQPNGLVLYTDDGGTYDFFELKLVEGALRLRYNLGGGAQIITVGRDLHDGHWHKVQVSTREEGSG